MQLQEMTKDQLIAQVMAMQAKSQRAISFKVTQERRDEATGKVTGTNGAISAYGLGRFPVTLYAGQWERLMGEVDALREFIKTNQAILSRKA